jgi:hypothetical protein
MRALGKIACVLDSFSMLVQGPQIRKGRDGTNGSLSRRSDRMARGTQTCGTTLKMSVEFAEWWDAAADRLGRTKISMVMDGLAKVAAEAGFESPPPRGVARMGRPRKGASESAA